MQRSKRTSNLCSNHDADAWFKFLRLICPRHLAEEIEGDLIQKYNGDLLRFGERKARHKLRWNIFGFLRPGILLRNRFSRLRSGNFMFRSHSKFLYRQAAANKIFSIINLLGLTLGITACLFIAEFIWFEYSFERFNERAHRTYRVNLYNTQNGVFKSISPGTVSGLAYSIKQLSPLQLSVARVGEKVAGIVSSDNVVQGDKETNIVFADAEIIDALDIDFIDGDKTSALQKSSSVIISASMAEKYFGSTHAVGKLLQIGLSNSDIVKKEFEVKGVFKDTPLSSHQKFEFILPPEDDQAWNGNWDWTNVFTYIVLPENVTPHALDAMLSIIVKNHHVDGASDRYLLEPITDIRLHALDGSGRSSIVNFFLILGVVILFLAWFNYINLSTAHFFERTKEVGIRKIVGASRFHLIVQVLTEAFVFNVISFAIAVIGFLLLWPTVTQLLNMQMCITLFQEPISWLFMLSFLIIATLSTGFYPALYLSAFKPLASLKKYIGGFTDRAKLRKVLVITQVTVSIVLITAVGVINRQLDFMHKQDLGIAIDQTLIIEEPLLTNATTVEKYEILKGQFEQLPYVKGVTYASNFAGSEIEWHRTDITLGAENAGHRYDSRIIAAGTEFAEVFGLTVMAGRNFDERLATDQKAMLMSEAACRMFGFSRYEEAIGKLVFIGSRQFEVIGVVKNYHYRSLQSPVQPILYIQGYPRNPRYAIKLSAANMQQAIANIEAKWKNVYAENVFKYYFLDEFFDRQYAGDRQASLIVTSFTVLAVFISCAGLFALSMHAIARKTKEIGIRQVFGATANNIVILLTKDFVKLTVAGGFIAIPVAYYLTTVWLERYAFKMPLTSLMFVLPFFVVLSLTLITISCQTISVARRKPAESMRHE